MKMARKCRLHYAGALYHVIVRGNNREKVFLGELHKEKYLNILYRYKQELGFNLYAFCIMDNHAHFLIGVHDISLSCIMQRVQQVYTQWFNRIYKRTGHVFQQRYKALLCNKEGYFLQLVKYIHRNPLEAGIGRGLDYKWSSHSYYMGREKGRLVDTDEALNLFGKIREKAIRNYLQFINQGQDKITDIEDMYEDIKQWESVGSKGIKSSNSSNSSNSSIDSIASDDGRKDSEVVTGQKPDVLEIIEEICSNENITIGEIARRTKIQRVSDIRKSIVILSEKYCEPAPKTKELAQILNLPPSMISKIKSGESKGTSYVEEVIERWEKGNGIKE